MAKSIHERVRAQLERAAREKVKQIGGITPAQERAVIRKQAREDALLAGEVAPRNAKERKMQDQAMLRDLGLID